MNTSHVVSRLKGGWNGVQQTVNLHSGLTWLILIAIFLVFAFIIVFAQVGMNRVLKRYAVKAVGEQIASIKEQVRREVSREIFDRIKFRVMGGQVTVPAITDREVNIIFPMTLPSVDPFVLAVSETAGVQVSVKNTSQTGFSADVIMVSDKVSDESTAVIRYLAIWPLYEENLDLPKSN